MSKNSASAVREDSGEDEDPPPFYSLDLQFPQTYHRLTKLVGMIDEFQTSYESATQGSSAILFQKKKPDHDIAAEDLDRQIRHKANSAFQELISIAEIEEAFENTSQFAQEPLIMDIVGWLGRGDYQSVLLLAKEFKELELGFPSLDGERNRAKFCAMVACNELQYVGFSRSQVTKPQIRDRADQIRAVLDLRKQKDFKIDGKRKVKKRGFKWSAQALDAQKKVGQLTKANWTQIWKSLGLADIQGNPGAQKAK